MFREGWVSTFAFGQRKMRGSHSTSLGAGFSTAALRPSVEMALLLVVNSGDPGGREPQILRLHCAPFSDCAELSQFH
jgi:hypothetical protein